MDAKRVIKQRGYNVKKVAQLLGKNYVALNAALNNGQISLTALRQIADVINCNVADFFADEPPRAGAEGAECAGGLTCPHCGEHIDIIVK